jgi:hypothetical protein
MRLTAVGLCLFAVAGSALAGSRAQNCVIEAPEWSPRGSATTARPRISVILASTCDAAIDPSSVRMLVDDEAVVPKVDGIGPKVTVFYTPEAALVQEADHTVVVQARDAKGASGEKRWTFHIGDTYSR